MELIYRINITSTHDDLKKELYSTLFLAAVTFKLESGQSMTSKQIHLDNIYNLEHNTAYEVYYMSTLTYIPCERSVEVFGFIESNHIDVSN